MIVASDVLVCVGVTAREDDGPEARVLRRHISEHRGAGRETVSPDSPRPDVGRGSKRIDGDLQEVLLVSPALLTAAFAAAREVEHQDSVSGIPEDAGFGQELRS